MIGLRSRSLAALVLIVSLAACKKEGVGDSVDLPADMKPHPAQGDPSKLAVPPLFANVPADTPYLFAWMDAIPPEFYARIKAIMQPMIALSARDFQKRLGENAVLDAIVSELDGKWNEAGFESLGFSATPRFALYGLGLQPAVMRISVKDEKAVKATIERVAAKAGKELPAMASKDGRSFWQYSKDGTTGVIALADNQLILAIGKDADVAAKLGLIVGGEKPAQSMADGALVKQLLARNGLGGPVIAFGDTKQIAGEALVAAGATPSPACTAEIGRLSAKLPYVVFGYGEMSAAKASAAVVVELGPDAVADLRALKIEVPGLAAALGGTPLFAMAGGVDLEKAKQVGGAIAGNLKQLGAACGLGSLADGADRAAATMAKPLPEPAGQIAGGAVVVDDFSMSGGDPMPKKLEGVMMVASPDAHKLFDKAVELAPPIKELGVAADGKMHDLQIPMPLPFPVAAGVGDRVIAVTAGTPRRAPTEKLLATHGGGKAPLLAVTYDFGKLADFMLQSMKTQSPAVDPMMLDTFQTMRAMLGRVSFTVDVTDRGLAFWSTLGFK